MDLRQQHANACKLRYLEESWTDVVVGDVENTNVKQRTGIINYIIVTRMPV